MNELKFIGLGTIDIYITSITEKSGTDKEGKSYKYWTLSLADDKGSVSSANLYDEIIANSLIKADQIRSKILDDVLSGKKPDLLPTPVSLSATLTVSADGKKYYKFS